MIGDIMFSVSVATRQAAATAAAQAVAAAASATATAAILATAAASAANTAAVTCRGAHLSTGSRETWAKVAASDLVAAATALSAAKRKQQRPQHGTIGHEIILKRLEGVPVNSSNCVHLPVPCSASGN